MVPQQGHDIRTSNGCRFPCGHGTTRTAGADASHHSVAAEDCGRFFRVGHEEKSSPAFIAANGTWVVYEPEEVDSELAWHGITIPRAVRGRDGWNPGLVANSGVEA